MPRAASTTKPTCVVSIGFTNVLLTADMGAKLMTMLASAIPVTHDTQHPRYTGWVAEPEPLRLEMQMVRPSDVRLTTPKPVPAPKARPLQLGNSEGGLL
jgi:hypothetical protein